MPHRSATATRTPIPSAAAATRIAVVLTVVVAALVVLAAPPATAADPGPAVHYVAPVPGPVIDPYRAPDGPYGPGNRGEDLATTPGEPVLAVADGDVTFAGQVGGALHVVILHADGLRSSLSFLAEVLVRRGQHVVQGEPVGRAGSSVHLGFRRGTGADEVYLDPAAVLTATPAPPPSRAALVPDGPDAPLGAGAEAGALARIVAGLGRAGRTAGGALARLPGPSVPLDRLESALLLAHHLLAAPGIEVLAALAGADDGPCTPASTPPPTAPGRGRLLVLVGGLGSGSGEAAVLDVPAPALGYAAADVIQASYRGGTARYRPVDTFAGVEAPAGHLAALLRTLARDHPGRRIDVVAHSMGGLVARDALVALGAPAGAVVTLATPHDGADLAGAARVLGAVPVLDRAGALVAGMPALGLDPRSRSIVDLAPGSAFLDRLDAAGAPKVPAALAAAVSLGARTDLIVPSTRTRAAGWRSTVVSLPAGDGLLAHERLPGSAGARRELLLALGGQPPTCRGAGDRLVDAAVAVVAQDGEAGVAAALALAAAPTAVVPVLP